MDGTGASPGQSAFQPADQVQSNALSKCKAESAGVPFVEVPAAGTSQECSRCGTKHPKALFERTHPRGECGLELDRDEKRDQKRAVSRPAHLRRSRGSGRDGARRSRGFRSALNSGVEDPSDSACAARKAAPGSRTVRIRLGFLRARLLQIPHLTGDRLELCHDRFAPAPRADGALRGKDGAACDAGACRKAAGHPGGARSEPGGRRA